MTKKTVQRGKAIAMKTKMKKGMKMILTWTLAQALRENVKQPRVEDVHQRSRRQELPGLTHTY